MKTKDDDWYGVVADTEVIYQKNDRISVRVDELEVHVIRTPEGYALDVYTTDDVFLGTQCIWDDELEMMSEHEQEN